MSGSTPRSIDELVGESPARLHELYRAGRPADPAALGASPKGRLLAFERTARLSALLRPALSLLSKKLLPWEGKSFDASGRSGSNRLLGRHALRFRCEVGPSELDGAPTLLVRYDDPSFRNPWPVDRLEDELRAVSETVAVGTASLKVRGHRVLLFWWGLEAEAR